MPTITGSGSAKPSKLRPEATGPCKVTVPGMSGPSPGVKQVLGLTVARDAWDNARRAMHHPPPEPLRIMLGFVVRQCAVALGHPPRPDEFAEWANNQDDPDGESRYHIFGRPISVDEARVIMRHPGRLVTVRPGPRWQRAAAAAAAASR